MKSFGVRGQLLLGFSLVLSIFVISSVFLSFQFRENVKNNDWTSHTYDVLLETEHILIALINIETGQRGYLISGVDSFLDPLNAGVQDFGKRSIILKN